MADMHILTGDGQRWRVAMHMPIPAGTNAANVPWADALVNSGVGGKTELPDGDGTGGTISTAEKALILAGSVYEHVSDFLIESGGRSAPNVRGSLRQFYATQKAEVQAELQRRLKYFGATEARV